MILYMYNQVKSQYKFTYTSHGNSIKSEEYFTSFANPDVIAK